MSLSTAPERRTLSARSFLVRGLLAGLIAGVVAFAVAYVVGGPPLNAAIALEQTGAAADPATGHSHDESSGGHSHDADSAPGSGNVEVPRSLQATLGLLTALAVAGTTLGGLIGVLSALALGRFGSVGARASTLAVTGIGFVSMYAVPFLVYPPNPPAVGSGDTIGTRTGLYVIALAISLIAAVTAVAAGRRLAARWGGWYAGLAAVAGYVVVVGAAFVLLPRFYEVPDTFPASVLYEFRTASFLTQLTLWVVLGLVLAEFVGRLSRTVRPDRELHAVDQ